MYKYANIDSSAVLKENMQAATRALIFCRSDLGIENMYILWFCDAALRSHESSFTTNNIIHGRFIHAANATETTDVFLDVRADIPLQDIIRAVFHEARHAYQYKAHGGKPINRGFNIEEDADRYADEAKHAFQLWPDPSALLITNKEFR